MMSMEDSVLQPPENGNGAPGGRRLPCPMTGCKRMYAEAAALERHVKDHDAPAKSLPAMDPRFKALPFLSEDERQDIYMRVVAEAGESQQTFQERAETETEEPNEVPVKDNTCVNIEKQDIATSPPTKKARQSCSLADLLGQTYSTGKKLLCSTSGCTASFPSMQKLMEHTRHHYKPNIYFQCESCRTKLRSYKGLLAHLHTCSKMPRAKPKAAEPAAPVLAAVAASNMTPKAADLAPPRLESVSSPQIPIQSTHPDGSLPAAAPLPDSADPPVLGPPILTLQELPPSQRVIKDSSPPPLVDKVCKAPASVVAPKPAADPSDVQSQQQVHVRTHGAVHAAPGSATYTPFAAVWRKNQDVRHPGPDAAK
ncbi:zinc finger protein 414 isoform X2 [Fundulus heteroclitus]|uniref:zinc finger protein 414 isoform X2 n=1 Tax=Fundulus heteroclitus TaxID=8078 RepID=UPI00165CA4C3|nr:zinc finger protein 414 isoform X2 [Fundulus heteroclitus]